MFGARKQQLVENDERKDRMANRGQGVSPLGGIKKHICEVKEILEELDGVIIRLAAITFLIAAIVKLVWAH